jgi:hypothetical protein
VTNMTHTPYRNLSDVELLRMVDEARVRSLIIEELAQRVERSNGIRSALKRDDVVTCPVCTSELLYDYNYETHILTVS